MKANKAPEKVILSADRDTQIIYDDWVVNDYTDNIKIEYVRADVFIEKAVSYIQQHWIWNTKTIEDFKNYMKGE